MLLWLSPEATESRRPANRRAFLRVVHGAYFDSAGFESDFVSGFGSEAVLSTVCDDPVLEFLRA